MAKRKIAYALSAVALTLGSGVLSPAVFADGETPFCVDDVSEVDTCYGTLQEAFDVAPTDGTLTNVYLAGDESLVKDGGAVLKNGQNVVFDLKGKVYDISQNTVGSTGTETNAFQLLKGSTFTLKNGSVIGTSPNAKIWIQNYANTTLEDIILDASEYSQAQYVASNNFGSLTVKGNTKIIASKTNNVGAAFDLWYGMNAVYDGGVTVVFGDDFTGTVKGNVEYGHHPRVAEDSGWRDKTELNISNGDFDITLKGSSNGALDGANINISGGSFSAKPSADYIEDGYTVVAVDEGVYMVKNKAAIEQGGYDVVENENGDNVELPKIVNYRNVESIATVDNGDKTVSGRIAFIDDFENDRVNNLNMVQVEADGLTLDAEYGGELIGAIEINMTNRDNVEIDVSGTKIRVYVDLDEENYNRLAAYDQLYVVYFENGVEKERIKADVVREEDDINNEVRYYLTFVTSHFSTYGVVGVNEATADAPETGTMTVMGASATSAAGVAVIAAGVLATIAGVAYLIRRKG